jgi:hypothetical protein
MTSREERQLDNGYEWNALRTRLVPDPSGASKCMERNLGSGLRRVHCNAALETFTVSVFRPTCRAKSTTSAAFTSSASPVCRYALNPFCLTSTVYLPTGKD